MSGPVFLNKRQTKLAAIKQIEYYFGDANLSRDKFTRGLCDSNDGWIPLTTMLKFRKLYSITSDVELIKEAILESTRRFIEVSEDGGKIRRSPNFPLPQINEEYKKNVEARTLHISGFPPYISMDMLLKRFKSLEIEDIRMEKAPIDGVTVFQGSITITFKALKGAKSFMKTPHKTCHGRTLATLWLADYKEEKKAIKQHNCYINLRTQREQKLRRTTAIFARGTVLKITNIPRGVTRRHIGRSITEFNVYYVSLHKKFNQAWVRLQEENAAYALRKACGGVLNTEFGPMYCTVLQGREEMEYLHLSRYRKR